MLQYKLRIIYDCYSTEVRNNMSVTVQTEDNMSVTLQTEDNMSDTV